MATSASVSVGTSPARLDNLAGLTQGQSLIIRNGNTAADDVLILGGENVTGANGYALAAGAQLQIGREPIWGIRATSATGNIATSVLSLGAV
jgi:hypothetical protein